MPNTMTRPTVIMFVIITETAEADMEVPLKRQKLLEQQREYGRCITSYNGVIHEIKTGEILASFQSAVCAFDAAMSLLQNHGHLNLRVGLHAGHAVIHHGKPQGAVINLASRLPWFSRSGGICLSEQVYTALAIRQQILLVRIGHNALRNFNYRTPLFAYLPSGQMPRRKINQLVRVIEKNRVKLNRFFLIGILSTVLLAFNLDQNTGIPASPGGHQALYLPPFSVSTQRPGSNIVLESIEFSVRARLAELSGMIIYSNPVHQGREIGVMLELEENLIQARYVLKPLREGNDIQHGEILGTVDRLHEFQDRLSEAIFLELSRRDSIDLHLFSQGLN